MSIITALRATPNGRAIRVLKDGAKWLTLPVHLVADLRLSTGDEMDDARVAEIEEAAAVERLWQAALRFTVGRGRAKREIVQRLRERFASDDQIATVLARLTEAGMRDEDSNADLRVEHLAVRGWAVRRIEGEMRRAGFTSAAVRRAVTQGLPDDHDARLLDAIVAHKGVPAGAADRRRMADRLTRLGLPPAAVRQALRPDDGDQDEEQAAPQAEELIRQVKRRYPGQVTDPGERRRALGWLARRGVGSDDARLILQEAAGGERQGGVQE